MKTSAVDRLNTARTRLLRVLKLRPKLDDHVRMMPITVEEAKRRLRALAKRAVRTTRGDAARSDLHDALLEAYDVLVSRSRGDVYSLAEEYEHVLEEARERAHQFRVSLKIWFVPAHLEKHGRSIFGVRTTSGDGVFGSNAKGVFVHLVQFQMTSAESVTVPVRILPPAKLAEPKPSRARECKAATSAELLEIEAS